MSLTKTFQIDYQSDIDNKRYSGTFTCKKLTVGDLSKLGLRKAQLSGGYSYDEESGRGVDTSTNLLNEMIAHCDISLIQKPEWFVAEDLTDVTLLQEVYQEVASFEANFHSKQPNSSGEEFVGSGEVSSGNQSQGSGGPDDSFEALVDKKVPKISQL